MLYKLFLQSFFKKHNLLILKMENPKIYCLRCKKHTENDSVKQVTTANNKQMLKGKCAECGSIKNRFVGSLTNTLADELHHRAIKKIS